MNNLSDKMKINFIEILQWTESVIAAVLIALLIRAYIFEPVLVQQVSMQDTLLNNQRLIIYKLGYNFNLPQRGDIVVFKYQDGKTSSIPLINKAPFLKKLIPDKNEVDYIKRVIALPGDSIDIKDGNVVLNGKILSEPYVKGITEKRNIEFPIEKVPDNKVFVLGDNRENSSDSRQFGFVDISRIKGKAVLRIWPIKVFGGIN